MAINDILMCRSLQQRGRAVVYVGRTGWAGDIYIYIYIYIVCLYAAGYSINALRLMLAMAAWEIEAVIIFRKYVGDDTLRIVLCLVDILW